MYSNNNPDIIIRLKTSEDVKNSIYTLLSLGNTRFKEINLLYLSELNILIDTIKVIKEDVLEARNALEQFKQTSAARAKREPSFDLLSHRLQFRRYVFQHTTANYYWLNPISNPEIPTEYDLNQLFLDLSLRKHQLKDLKNLKEMIQNDIQPLDPEEKSEVKITSHAENSAALKALGLYESLLQDNRKLYTQAKVLQSELEENIKVRELQKEELHASFKKFQDESMQAQSQSAAEIRKLQTTVDDLGTQLHRFQSTNFILDNKRLTEENSHLFSEIKDQVQKHTIERTRVPREVLLNLLLNLKEHKTRMKIFSPTTRNVARQKLKELSEQQQDYFSSEEIRACIQEDSLLLQIFNNPTIHSKNTGTIRLIRTLGELFKAPDAAQSAPNGTYLSFGSLN